MKTVYIDKDCKVFLSDSMDRTAVETDVFDGKCQEWIEGHRYVPANQKWTREDGEVFEGTMITPWKPISELDRAQREYERQLLADYESALAEIEKALGV